MPSGTMTAQALVERMRELNMQVIIEMPSPRAGQIEVHRVPLGELLRFASLRRAHIPDLYGIPRDAYDEWQRQGQHVWCAGTALGGSRCRHVVPGGYCVSLPTWVKMQGALCWDHNGGRALQRRAYKSLERRRPKSRRERARPTF